MAPTAQVRPEDRALDVLHEALGVAWIGGIDADPDAVERARCVGRRQRPADRAPLKLARRRALVRDPARAAEGAVGVPPHRGRELARDRIEKGSVIRMTPEEAENIGDEFLEPAEEVDEQESSSEESNDTDESKDSDDDSEDADKPEGDGEGTETKEGDESSEENAEGTQTDTKPDETI